VRGFGARSTFGIRGVRLYVDDIPATLPDGQGQITNVDLGSAERIEVLRGPFSALYGNSSGGVIQVFTEDGTGPPSLGAALSGGSYGALRVGAKASGAVGAFGYVVSGSNFHTDGYRDHSAAERNIGNAKLTWRTDADKWTLIVNHVDLPKAQDPLGLTRAEFDADPRSVDPAATQFDTRKTVEQTQVGATWERRLDAVNTLRALAYGGHRSTVQFQAIPVAPGEPSIRAASSIWGATTAAATCAGPRRRASPTAVHDRRRHRLRRARRAPPGYQKFVGTARRQGRCAATGQHRHQHRPVRAGVGRSPSADRARRRAKAASLFLVDHYIVGANPTTAASELRRNAAGRGPALHRDRRRPSYAAPGGFRDADPERARLSAKASRASIWGSARRRAKRRAGVKTRSREWGGVNLAVFQTNTDNESRLTNVGGRSTFRTSARPGAAASRRRGTATSPTTCAARLRRHLDARYRDAFTTCNVTPCAAPNIPVPAGNNPGLARKALRRWTGRRCSAGAAASNACARPRLRQRRQLGCRRGLCGVQRARRLPARWRATICPASRASKHLRQAPCRIGDRQRRQRPLLRARAGRWTVGVAATAAF
jgi:iron complex outermembrane receptor protein